MRYIYILLCALSSFFNYKSLHASELEHINAFFIPESAINENTKIRELQPNQTPTKTKKIIKKRRIKKRIPAPRNPTKIETVYTVPSSNSTQSTSDLSPKRTFPVERTTLTKELSPTTSAKTDSKTLSQPEIIIDSQISTPPLTAPSPQTTADSPKATPQNKYTLDDNILAPTYTPPSSTSTEEEITDLTDSTKPTLATTDIETLQNTPVEDLFAKIPYPTTVPPLYKQLYHHHISDLRTLYRRGNFLPNPLLNRLLEKPVSLKRFEVPDS